MTARIFVSGFVQGVGFRHFIRSKAKELGLTGWAKNLPDGSVEVLVQGEKSSIEQLIKQCKKGPFLSEVEKIDMRWEDSKEKFASFDII